MTTKTNTQNNSESAFLIYIDGKLASQIAHKKTLADNREDAIWHLGAKYGAGKYNEMYNNGQIVWSDTQVTITTTI
jgi:hypothetical protein